MVCTITNILFVTRAVPIQNVPQNGPIAWTLLLLLAAYSITAHLNNLQFKDNTNLMFKND